MKSKQMIKLGEINENSYVLDLGCGYGKALLDVCKATGCKGVGLDLSESNIEQCNKYAQNNPDLDMKFAVGSFTDVPRKLKEEKFTHVFSQYAFCHVHKELLKIFQEAHQCLRPGGKLVCFDYMGAKNGEKPTIHIIKHCYDRLHFTYLAGHKEFKEKLQQAKFEIKTYLELDEHIAFAYNLLGEAAKTSKVLKENGDPLWEDYIETSKYARKGLMGQNLFVAIKNA